MNLDSDPSSIISEDMCIRQRSCFVKALYSDGNETLLWACCGGRGARRSIVGFTADGAVLERGVGRKGQELSRTVRVREKKEKKEEEERRRRAHITLQVIKQG